MLELQPDDLKAIRLFKGIAWENLKETLEKITPHCHLCTFQARQEIPLVRRARRFVYFIKSGYVTVRSFKRFSYEETYFLAWRGKSMLLGDMIALGVPFLEQKEGLDCGPVLPPEITATDECQMIEFPEQDFRDLLAAEPLIYRNTTLIAMDKLAQERRRIEVIQIPGASALPRVAMTLCNLCISREFRPGTNILDGTIRTVDIAGYIGILPEAVNTSLRRLCEDGAISLVLHRGEIVNGEITILDLDKLQDDY